MKKIIVTLMLIVGLCFVGSANATQPVPAGFTTVEELKNNKGCLEVSEHSWSEGSDLLATNPEAVQATVYAFPADKTAVVNKYTNKATESAVASVGSVRLVCTKQVGQNVNVVWS